MMLFYDDKGCYRLINIDVLMEQRRSQAQFKIRSTQIILLTLFHYDKGCGRSISIDCVNGTNKVRSTVQDAVIALKMLFHDGRT